MLPPSCSAVSVCGLGDEDHDGSLFLRRDGENTRARIKLAFRIGNLGRIRKRSMISLGFLVSDGWIPDAATRGNDPTPLWGLWRGGFSTPIRPMKSARRLFCRLSLLSWFGIGGLVGWLKGNGRVVVASWSGR